MQCFSYRLLLYVSGFYDNYTGAIRAGIFKVRALFAAHKVKRESASEEISKSCLTLRLCGVLEPNR